MLDRTDDIALSAENWLAEFARALEQAEMNLRLNWP